MGRTPSQTATGPTYHPHDRGDRLRPKRTSRVYCHLSQLRDKLQQLIDSEALPGGETILDYGCGNKPYAPLFRNKFQLYVGADMAGNAAAELVIGPNGELPLPEDSVDCVLSSQVLEHVISPRAYLKEGLRVLKPGSSLILSTHGIWPYHPDPTDFWRWTIDGLQKEIQLAGFEILSIRSVFGIESVALQLWQDATYERLPLRVQPLYTWFFQSIIGLIEGRQPNKTSNDACVYIILARKPHPKFGADGRTKTAV